MATTIEQTGSKLQAAVTAPTRDIVIHFLTLRKAIGFIGFTLPIILVGGENLRDTLAPRAAPAGRGLIEVSLSAYYHTGMRDVFVGCLCAVGIFLICYNGYQRIDNLLANVAGGAALLVALCPSAESSQAAGSGHAMTLFGGLSSPDPAVIGVLHFAAATVFLVVLAGMSIFLFTKSGGTQTPQKRRRNRVYVACGIIILLSISVIPLGKLFLSARAERATSFTFWAEAIAIASFGVSWLVKGEAILKDQ